MSRWARFRSEAQTLASMNHPRREACTVFDGGDTQDDNLIKEQLQYYRERAGEYDQWFFREGRYDRGPAHRDRWFAELEMIEAALREVLPSGDVLELACGSGLWTQHLVAPSRRVTAVDASPEAIELNRARVGAASIRYVIADLFSWSPPARFDLVFFAFWLSHVPSSRLEAFWELVGSALKPGGIVFFVDSLIEQTSTAVDHPALDESGVVRRRLNDGRTFQIVKVFHDPETLERQLHARGWDGCVRASGKFFLYGSVECIRTECNENA
jgi:2-polyprenyl-3-methyl-5-hydroxy-6-metoxy-1,4-benzoquinol methylase